MSPTIMPFQSSAQTRRRAWLRFSLPSAFMVATIMLNCIASPVSAQVSQFYDGASATTTWDTTSPVWGAVSGGPYNTVWVGGNDAVFEGISATITGAAADVQNITFGVSGYNINTTTINLVGTPPNTVLCDTNAVDTNGVTAVIGGVIAGSGISLTKTGAGTLTLSGNNTFSGNMSINAGTVNANTLGSNGVASSIGAGYVIRMGGTSIQGILNYTGAGNTSDRVIDLQGTIAGGTMQLINNGTGPLVFVGSAGATNDVGPVPGAAVTASPPNVSKSLRLGGTNTMDNNIIGNIVNPGGGTGFRTSINKDGTGTWGISGANNNFTSTLNVNAGTLFFGADDPITACATLWVNSATVDLRGHHVTVNQASLLIMGINSPSVTPDNAGGIPLIMDSVGGGKIVIPSGLTYNSGVAPNFNGQGLISCNVDVTNGNPKSFTIAGRGLSEPDLVISGVISSDGATGGFELLGGGVLKITGTNTYAGQTRVRDGTLILGANNTLPYPPKSGNNLTLRTRFVPLTTVDLYGTTNSVNNLTLGDAANINAGLQARIIDSVGNGLLKLGGTLTYNPGTIGSGFETGPCLIAGNLDLNGTNRTFTVNASVEADPELLISGVIQNSTGVAGLTKAGTGVLVLSGNNTYNGNTTISGGVLSISMPYLTGTVTIATNAILDLNFAGQNTVSNLVLNGVVQQADTYDATTHPDYFTGTGQLVVLQGPAIPTTPTNLTFSVSGTDLTFSWPSNYVGWSLLVQTNNLAGGVSSNPNDWAVVPNSATTNLVIIPIDQAKPAEYYRMAY